MDSLEPPSGHEQGSASVWRDGLKDLMRFVQWLVFLQFADLNNARMWAGTTSLIIYLIGK